MPADCCCTECCWQKHTRFMLNTRAMRPMFMCRFQIPKAMRCCPGIWAPCKPRTIGANPMVYAVGSPMVSPVGPATVFTEHWDAKSSSIPAGSYQFKITVRDFADNEFTAYPDFIKDGIQPVINHPRPGASIGGAISIRGSAQDPDLGNGDPFARYADQADDIRRSVR